MLKHYRSQAVSDMQLRLWRLSANKSSAVPCLSLGLCPDVFSFVFSMFGEVSAQQQLSCVLRAWVLRTAAGLASHGNFGNSERCMWVNGRCSLRFIIRQLFPIQFICEQLIDVLQSQSKICTRKEGVLVQVDDCALFIMHQPDSPCSTQAFKQYVGNHLA